MAKKSKKRPGREPSVIALDLKGAELTPAMAAYFDKCQEKLGFVPNVLTAYAHDMAKLEAFSAFYNNLMLAPSGLSKLEREMIAVAVSADNKCFYCQTAHGAAVRQISGVPQLGERMAMNWRSAGLPPRQYAMLAFAEKVTFAARGSRKRTVRRCATSAFPTRNLGYRRGRLLLQHVQPHGLGGRYAAERRISCAGAIDAPR